MKFENYQLLAGEEASWASYDIYGDVVSACADACPSGAISFGDWNDTTSAVNELSKSDRAYQALEEIGVKPNVYYQLKVRNVDATTAKAETADTHEESH